MHRPFGSVEMPAKVAEVEPALAVKDQVIRHVAGRCGNDRLHTRSVGLHCQDRTSSLGEIHGSDEDAAVLVNGQATRTHPIQDDNSGEMFIWRSRPEHAAGRIHRRRARLPLRSKAGPSSTDALV